MNFVNIPCKIITESMAIQAFSYKKSFMLFAELVGYSEAGFNVHYPVT